MARLQNEVGTKDSWFEARIFSYEKSSEISPKSLSLYFLGPKKSRQFPRKISLPKIKEITAEPMQEGRENTIARLPILFRVTPLDRLQRQAFSAMPPLVRAGHFFIERSGGVAAIVCDTTGNTERQGYC